MEDPVAPVDEELAAEGALACRIVLCRTRNPQNLGAAARALRNAGLRELWLVDPQTGDFEAARPLAVHAEDLLESARIVSTLREATAGCGLVLATTARTRPERTPLSPRDAVARIASARTKTALVFGDERSGLTAEEVEACDLLVRLPGSPEQPSWNLAQAVAICAYELRVRATERVPEEGTFAAQPTAADPAALAAIDRALSHATDELGKPGLRRRLYRTLERARPSNRESALWIAFLRAITRTRSGSPPR